MKKSIILFILFFTVFFIHGCQKEEPLDITIHTFRYTMEGVSYVDKVKTTPDDITENTFDLIFASNMLDRIQTEVYLNTYEDYRALHHSNDTPYTYEESFFDTHSLLVIPIYSSKAPYFELSSFDLIDGKLNLSLLLISSPLRDISYISYSFISDYYQILVEINRKDILDYDYQITEQDQKNFFVYFGDDAYLENDYQFITDYQTFYDLFKNSSATWYSYSVLDLVSESLFDDYYVFAYQRTKGVHLNAQLYDYHINLSRVDTEVSYVLYLTFVDDYSYQLTAFDDSLTTLYLLMIPNTLLMDFEYVIIHGLSDGQIIYDLP